jgi:Uma2 family endonuclease
MNGDHMGQAEFHRKYLAYPDDTKFELIGGTVYVASPLGLPHADFHFLLSGLFWTYSDETPGVQGLDNCTLILDEENEVQPDLAIRLLPEFGGKSSVTKNSYLQGSPELIVEIAQSSRAIDLYQKKDAYRRAGVQEYLVLAVKQEVVWFDFRSRKVLSSSEAGICKSRVFPGLWLDTAALLNQRKTELKAALRAGLDSPEHAAFVTRLKARRQR